MTLSLALALLLPAAARARPVYTHAVSPTAVFLTGSGWDAGSVKEELAKVQRIYDQCGIELDPVRVVEMEPLDGHLDLYGQYDADLVRALGMSERPLLFFLRSVGAEAYSFGDDHSPDSPQKDLDFTSWLGLDIRTPEYRARVDPSYSPVAHELGHVLCSCGHDHSGTPNLMSGDVKLLSDKLTPAQCEAFKRSPLVRRLP